METDEGIYGLGEVGIREWGGAIEKAIEHLSEMVVGEDPLRSENPSSYRNLARHVSLPIAAGEQWASKWAFREVIEEELINYTRIDLCIVGGLTEALKVTNWCETHYIDIAPPITRLDP
ncbi:MAG: enolase C-terminal domain-like protein [Candidatus Bathyarchaeia archaeon]